KKTSEIYVVASPNSLPSQVSSDSGGNFLLAKAVLNSASLPTWTTASFNIDATVTRKYNAIGDGEFSMTVTEDASGNPIAGWITATAQRDASTQRGYLVTRFNTTNFSLTKRAENIATNSTCYWPQVTQSDATGDVVVFYKRLLGSANGWQYSGWQDS